MLVTLTGGAGAGKTTLAAALAATALAATGPDGRVRVLHGDDYYVTSRAHGVWTPDDAGVPRLDVGDPRSMDVERLGRDADTALAGGAVVVVEGMFAHGVDVGTRCARFDVFVELAADLRLVRKIQRKCLRDGFPLDVLLRNYLDHRRDAHELHVEPVRERCDLVVSGADDPAVLAGRIWTAISGR